MLTIFIRAILLFTVLLIVMRLMGKRQIGEMEPYELAITLVIAELACIPMADKSIPLAYGIVSILTMYFLHQVILLVSKNAKIRNFISGKPVLVIDKNGINYAALKAMSLRTSDLLQAMRTDGCFSVEDIDFALFETNGQLSVLKKAQVQNEKPLPVPVLVDGDWQTEEIQKYSVDETRIRRELKKLRLKEKDLLLVTIDENKHLFVQPKNKAYFTTTLQEEPT